MARCQVAAVQWSLPHRQVFAVSPPPHVLARGVECQPAAAVVLKRTILWSHINLTTPPPAPPHPQLIPLPFPRHHQADAPRAQHTRYHSAALRPPSAFETGPSDFSPIGRTFSSPPGPVALPLPPWAVACVACRDHRGDPRQDLGRYQVINHGRWLSRHVWGRHRWVQYREPLLRRTHRSPHRQRRRHGFNRSHSSWFSIWLSISHHTFCRKLASRPRRSLDVHLSYRCRRLQPAALAFFPNQSFLGLPNNPTVRRDHRSHPLWSGTELGRARLPEPGRASATHPREPRPASERATAPPTRTISPVRY